MSCILDTSFLVALHNQRDLYFQQANKIKTALLNNEYGECYISDYIFDEFVTLFLARTGNSSLTIEYGEALLQDPATTCIMVQAQLFERAWQIFKQYKILSFTDATIVAIMEEFNIKQIISFDKHFDSIKDIKRLY